LINGQDSWITNFRLNTQKKSENKLDVIVKFNNFDYKNTITFHFNKIKNKWYLNDITNPDSFTDVMKKCLKDF
jgi:hypothetical protein